MTGAVQAEPHTKERVEAAGDCPFEAAKDLAVAETFLASSFDVADGLGVDAHALAGDGPERVVGLAVAASVEAVSVGLAA